MKKRTLLRTLCACLTVCIFAGMAMASSASNTKETGSVTIDGNGNTATTADGQETTEATTTTAEQKAEYEIVHTTFTHYKNSLKRENYCGVVEIKNTGKTYIYLKDCTFDFEDNDGHLLQSDTMVSKAPDVIAPGELGYFFHDGLIDEGVSLKNGIKLVPTFTIDVCKKGQEAIVDYDVSDVAIRDNNHGLGLKVTGRLTNNTTEATNSIDVMVVVVFFDKKGEILDIGYTYANEMAAGGKTSFEVTTIFGNKKVKKKDVADYKVIARGNFMQF